MAINEPIYESKPTLINLRQRYLVFPDRVELRLRLGRKMIIPAEEIVVVDRRDKALIFDLAGGHPHFSRVPALYLDLSDLRPHVSLVKTSGAFKSSGTGVRSSWGSGRVGGRSGGLFGSFRGGGGAQVVIGLDRWDVERSL